MRRMHRGLVAALENEELQNDTLVDENAVEVAEADADLSDEVAEVTDSAAEGEADTAEVEEASEVAEALESIAEAVGVAAQNGGLNQHAAAAIGIAVEHMYNRVGITAQAMPALESFGSSSQRMSSTNLAMEDIKEQASKIWNAIVEAIKKAIKWAVDFYNKIFGAAEKLEKRAQALTTKVEGITGGKAKEATFENERLVKALHTSGKVTQVGAGLEKIKTLSKFIFDEHKAIGAEVGTAIIEDLQKADSEKNFAENFEVPVVNVMGLKEIPNPEGHGFSAPAEGLSLYCSDELPGGQAVIARAPKRALKGEAAIDAMRGFGGGMSPADPKAKAPTDNKVATLQTKDMLGICTQVENLAVVLKGYRTAQSKLNEMKKKFQAAAEKAATNAKGADEEAKAGFKAIAKVAAAYPRFIDQPAASFSAYVLNTGKAALDYVDASCKQYGKEK